MKEKAGKARSWVIPAMINVILILIGLFALTTQKNIAGLIRKKQWLAEHLGMNALWPAHQSKNLMLLDAAFHLAVFLLLTLSLLALLELLSPARDYVIPVVVVLLILAAVDEYWQTTIPGRQASLLDFFCDALGILWGVIVFILQRRTRYRRFSHH